MKLPPKLITTLGVFLIISGLVLAGYPAWLWVEGRLEQNRLAREFAGNEPALVPDDYFPGEWERPRLSRVETPLELPEYTDFPATKVIIPKINVEAFVVKVTDLGVFARRSNQPPGYYPHSAFPGEVGNVAIAGHRGGPAGFFRNLDRLKEGDLIILRTNGFDYNYTVERVWITNPNDWQVVESTDYAALTLTTCEPVGTNTSAMRLIVRAIFRDVVANDGT
jgi:sortase A